MDGTTRPRPTIMAVAVMATLSGLVAMPSDDAVAATTASSTREMLRALELADETPGGFTRAGTPRWADADRDGCSTKAEVLIREARKAPEADGSCTLTGGSWRAALDGKRVTDAKELAIDHTVPLSEAWRSGAREWSGKERKAYVNDLGFRWSLQVVTRASRAARAEQDPADWLPERERLACSYVTRWTAVKYRWGLTVDRAERAALRARLRRCDWPRVPGLRVPAIPDVTSWPARQVRPASLLARCRVTTGEDATVFVRFGQPATPLARRSRLVAVPPGTTTVKIRLTGLLSDTTYSLACRVTTDTIRRVAAERSTLVRTGVPVAPTAVPAPTPTPGVPTPGSGPTPSPAPTGAPTGTPTSTTPEAPSPSPTPSQTPTPEPGVGTTVVAAGDMCEPDPVVCDATGRLAGSLTAAFYALLGDIQYELGTVTEWRNGYAESAWYDPPVQARSRPAIGNHEIDSGTDAGYCAYFSEYCFPAGRRYYAYDIDVNWRAIVLDSNPLVEGTGRDAAQLAWLDAELASPGTRAKNLLVYWHHPRWANSSRNGRANPEVAPFLERVHDAGADIVLWGHDHLYTRFDRMSPTGPSATGVRAFSVGTGGTGLSATVASPPKPGTQKVLKKYGVLRLTLGQSGFSWQFLAVDGQVLDRGSDTVRS